MSAALSEKQSTTSSIDWRRVGRTVVILLVLALASLFVGRIPRTSTIFLVGALLAFGVEPMVNRLKQHMPKVAAIALVFLFLTLLVVLGLVVVVPLTIEQTQALGANMPTYAAALQHWLTQTQVWLQHRVPGLRVSPDTFDLGQVGSARADAVASTALASIGTILVDTGTAFFVAFSAIVLSFFFLMYDAKISDGFASLFPVRRRETARKLSAEISVTFGRYISGQVTVSAITGLVTAGLSAIVGFKLPWILFIITFIGYSFPMIGMVIAQLTAIVLCAPQGASMILWVQAIMFVVGRISDNVLVPRIMGQSVGVSPIGVMFAVFAGGELFGLPGLLLAVPLAALIKILWRYFGKPWYQAQIEQ